jgi:hypothetical protein
VSTRAGEGRGHQVAAPLTSRTCGDEDDVVDVEQQVSSVGVATVDE